jgi:hypothetical protein
MNKHFLLAGILGALLVSGCGGGDSPTPDGGTPDGGRPDGGEGGGQPDGGEVKHELAPPRPLLGTSAQNLLLDPLVTTDQSLEHFIGIVVLGGQSYAGYQAPRAIHSQSPAGVALPVATVDTLGNIQAGATRLQVVAPLPGSSSPLEASVWVSAGDAAKAPASFSDAAKDLVVSLLPNDKPTKTYPLAVSGKPVTLAGRSWVKFTLPAAVSMPQGGWFSMTTVSAKWTYELQAPEVVTSAAHADAKSAPASVVVDRDPADAVALSAYVEIARHHRPPPH